MALVSFFIYKEAKSQYAIAGYHGNVFIDIAPDVYLPVPAPSSGGSNFYNIDVNQDGVDDIQFKAASGHTAMDFTAYRQVYALNSNVSLAFSGKHSTGTCANNPILILSIFNFGDTIKNDSFVTSGYLSYVYTNYGNCNSSGGVDTGRYIGIKYQSGITVSYGWVKLKSDTANGFLIREFSLGTPMVGIEPNTNKENYFSVYPNPSANAISLNISGVTNYQNSNISIQNTLGETVKKIPFSKDIDISDLAEGCYFLQVTLPNGETYKTKFIKQ